MLFQAQRRKVVWLGNVWTGSVGYDQRIFVLCGVTAAIHMPPRKLTLATQILADNAFVKRPAFCIGGSIGPVEGMKMGQQNQLDAAFRIDNSRNIELTAI